MTKREMQRLIRVFEDTFLNDLIEEDILDEAEIDLAKLSFILGYEQALKETKPNGKRKVR